MATSPSRTAAPSLNTAATLPPPHARTNRTIRKPKSAHALSSHHHANGNNQSSSLHQRQQQQQQHQPRSVNPNHREYLTTHAPPVPPVPQHRRARSNSDAVVTGIPQNALGAKKQVAAKKMALLGCMNAKGTTLDGLVREGPRYGHLLEGLHSMRFQVLSNGVASDGDGMSSLRIYIWMILLCAPPIATDDYLALVHRGPSPAYAKIRNDTFRTLATDPLFRRRVSEASLIRLLNAVAWTLHDAKVERAKASNRSAISTATSEGSPRLGQILPVLEASQAQQSDAGEGSQLGGSEPGTYVQGMNVLAAPFLYAARSEAEAYVAFHRFMTLECPGYVRGAMDGVHRGLALVDKVLAIVDPKLSAYLLSKSMHAELYAFPSVLTLCACTPPLPEVLHLWDFLFAYGAHLNILCIVAQLIMMRDTIINNPSPTKILRSFPPLRTDKIKPLAISLLPRIPDDVYGEIVRHAK